MKGDGQTVEVEQLNLSPNLPRDEWVDAHGNRFLRTTLANTDLDLSYSAEVTTNVRRDEPGVVGVVPLAELPMERFAYLAPSRYCQSDKLQRFALASFCHLPPGYQRVTGICNWIREYVSYEQGSTTPMTSAFDTVTERVGVCRDFAHLAVALCRALSIPARYVSAYAEGLTPPDFHAAMEVYLRGPQEDGWYLFDPTRMASVDRIVRIGVGRDAADIAFCSAYGNVTFDAPVVTVKGVSGEATTDAVRLA